MDTNLTLQLDHVNQHKLTQFYQNKAQSKYLMSEEVKKESSAAHNCPVGPFTEPSYSTEKSQCDTHFITLALKPPG